MLTLLKKWRLAFAVLIALAVTLLLSFFTLGRAVRLKLTPHLPSVSSKKVDTNDHPAPRRNEVASLDADADGIPDAAELQTFMDRENFRRWFSGIAEMQFYKLSEHWHPEQRDCSGLVRFAWRESLRRHDRTWYIKMGPGYEGIAPDVSAYTLEKGPLGEKLFRTDFGTYEPSDLSSGKFSEFADARTLKSFNTVFISRDRSQAQPGDLLFFHQPWVQKFPFHVMIFIGQGRVGPDGSNDWVVYHTGSSPTEGGAVKKVRLSTLDQHPNPRWRPLSTNRNFLGFYRLKILHSPTNFSLSN